MYPKKSVENESRIENLVREILALPNICETWKAYLRAKEWTYEELEEFAEKIHIGLENRKPEISVNLGELSLPATLRRITCYPLSLLQNIKTQKLSKKIEQEGILCFKSKSARASIPPPSNIEEIAYRISRKSAEMEIWGTKAPPVLIVSRSAAIEMCKLAGFNVSEKDLSEHPEEFLRKSESAFLVGQYKRSTLMLPAFGIACPEKNRKALLSIFRKRLSDTKGDLILRESGVNSFELVALEYKKRVVAVLIPPSTLPLRILTALYGANWETFIDTVKMRPVELRTKLKAGEESEILGEYLEGLEINAIAKNHSLPESKISALFRRFGRNNTYRKKREEVLLCCAEVSRDSIPWKQGFSVRNRP